MNGSTPPVPSDGPIPAELLADLQAGLLDDATAARLRRRIRTDAQAGPDARATLAALDRVRRDLAELGRDDTSAPSVPAEVSARLTEALRAQPPLRPVRRWKVVGAVAGGGAAVAAAVLGVVMLLHPAQQGHSTGASLGRITVSPTKPPIGLSENQILGLLEVSPDLGPLSDPRHRAGCLSALGYPPGVRVLGGRPLQVGGSAGVLLVLPADAPNTVTALVVPADCDTEHAGLLAQTMAIGSVRRP